MSQQNEILRLWTLVVTLVIMLIVISGPVAHLIMPMMPLEETWPTVVNEPFKPTIVETPIHPWQAFDKTSFSAGEVIAANLTLIGETPYTGNGYEPRMCVLTASVFKSHDTSKSIEDQAVNCSYAYSYELTAQRYVVKLPPTVLPISGDYYFVFLANHIDSVSIMVYQKHVAQSVFAQYLPYLLDMVGAVVGLLAGRAYLKRKKK
jgi:hypothetical protein